MTPPTPMLPPTAADVPTLEHLLTWLTDHDAGHIDDVLYQDEFTADVIVALNSGGYWVFDST